MPVLRSSVDTGSETYRRNRRIQLAAVAALNEQLELARVGGGEVAIESARSEAESVFRKRRFVYRAIYR